MTDVLDARTARSGDVPGVLPSRRPRIAAVVPCYRVGRPVLDVLARIGPEVDRIYVVDDACPARTGDQVEAGCADPRVRVLRNGRNLGVGGAVVRGYREALAEGAEVVVKIDGDGQMDPAVVGRLVQPILAGDADYAKGNRFAAYSSILRRTRGEMPAVRWMGNSVLSFCHKLVSGYWNIMDPTNGFTAIHRHALRGLDLDRMSPGFFFETDMLFQLNVVNAVVRDVPIPAHYGDEVSNLRVGRVLREFPSLMVRRFARRLLWKYFVYDFNVASLELLFGTLLVSLGAGFGAVRWLVGAERGQLNSAGTVMLAALPIILGFQLLLAAVSYDVAHVPSAPLQRQAVDE